MRKLSFEADVLKLLDDKAEIQIAQELLLSKLNKKSGKPRGITIVHQGGPQKQNARWNGELDIWWATKDKNNRFWNAFGTGEPKWNTDNGHIITCEINSPHEGINRRIAGVFAKNSEDKLYLFHRGRFGGRITKALFEREFGGSWKEVEDGAELTKLALVASFDSPRFAEEIAKFVHEVERIKNAVRKKTNR
jgi:hypothetical protein